MLYEYIDLVNRDQNHKEKQKEGKKSLYTRATHTQHTHKVSRKQQLIYMQFGG